VVVAAIQAVAVTLVVAAVAVAHAAEAREAVSREFKIQNSRLGFENLFMIAVEAR